MKNIYNQNKKGFLIGIERTMKQIINTNTYNKNKIMKTNQNELKKFITLLTIIYTNGIILPPILIYKGEFKDLQNIQIQDIKEKDKVYFRTSSNK